MTVTDPEAPVHLAGKRSREAAIAHDKQAWLDNFADDAVVEDPIGPSHFDPDGTGHRGKDAIAKFFDMAIAPSALEFHFDKTYVCGQEEANVGHIVIVASGYRHPRPAARQIRALILARALARRTLRIARAATGPGSSANP